MGSGICSCFVLVFAALKIGILPAVFPKGKRVHFLTENRSVTRQQLAGVPGRSVRHRPTGGGGKGERATLTDQADWPWA